MSNIKLNKIFKTVCIASDHAGFNLKENIKNYLIDKNVSVFDLALTTIIPSIIQIMPKSLEIELN